MLRIYILTILLFSVAYGADHNTFKNCSRVSFCSEFRRQTLDSNDQYAAKTADFKIAKNSITIPLQNSNGKQLNLQAYLLQGGTIRIKIVEEENARYELEDVLVGEPKPTDLNTVVINSNSITFGTKQEWAVDPVYYKITVFDGPPFSIEFDLDDQRLTETKTKIILHGDRLIMQNTDESQAFSFDVEFPDAAQLYGLSHHAYKLGLGDTANSTSDPFRLRNSDTGGYEVDSPMALYGSIPVIYGNSGTTTCGIFLHNAAEQWVDISYSNKASAYFMVESGTLDLFILLGPTPVETVQQYTNLTGVAHMPQLWTLGYHQSRYSYMTQEEVLEVVNQMDEHDFPLDAIWLDIDYTDEKKYFTWDPERFSDPVGLQKNLSLTNRKLVTILDPHIKVDNDYAVYQGAKDKYFIKWANGSDFQGNCWPGLSSYLDFLNPEVRDYYADWYSYEKFNGSTETLAGVWNDMNEPSVFFDGAYENTMPFETLHYGNVLHRDIHNIYGFLQTKATHQGLMQRDEGRKRPFVLTRSHFAGSQRYAAMWTGDNTAGWSYLSSSYSECLTANILGMVFCGADIGGFSGNPDTELLQRWYQAAAWLPFFRNHADTATERREPYLFDEDIQTVIRNAIRLRYQHIPVWYTLFYEHTRYGEPVIRPLFYTYPSNLENGDHLLLGTDILVRPVFESGATQIKVVIPSNHLSEYWFRIDDDSWDWQTGPREVDVTVDINSIPLYYRGRTIIPRKRVVKPSTTDMMEDSYTLYVNLDTINLAEGRLYVDDYTSFDYVNQNAYLYLGMTYLHESNGIRIYRIDESSNSTGLSMTVQSVVIHSTSNSRKEYNTTADGTPLATIDIVRELESRRSEGGFVFNL